MKKSADLQDLLGRLAAGQIVPVPAADWPQLAPGFPTREVVPTGLAGDILLVRRAVPGSRKQGWAIVESPPLKAEKVVRPLDTEQEARALIADRLAAYERMWDG